MDYEPKSTVEDQSPIPATNHLFISDFDLTSSDITKIAMMDVLVHENVYQGLLRNSIPVSIRVSIRWLHLSTQRTSLVTLLPLRNILSRQKYMFL